MNWYEQTVGKRCYSLTLGHNPNDPQVLLNGAEFDWRSVSDADRAVCEELRALYREKGLAEKLSIKDGDYTYGLAHDFKYASAGRRYYGGVDLTIDGDFLEARHWDRPEKLQNYKGRLSGLYRENGLGSWLEEPNWTAKRTPEEKSRDTMSNAGAMMYLVVIGCVILWIVLT